jgi:predicted molibdopterin-dependent oxidoreductase YjgC
MLAEEITDTLDAYRLPLSAIAEANVVAVLGDVPLTESAPVVDLWVKKARRNGAKVVASADEIGDAERVVLIWSGPHGRGGAVVAAIAEKLGLAGKDGCGAFYVPTKPNGRGVADAWAAASDEEGPEPDPIGLLLVSGDEAANDANVRALAEAAESVIVVSMFQGLAAGWADLVIPGTSTLERDGTYVNLEGRLQRLRRAATPPAPDELWWLSQLAARFGIELAASASGVFAAVSERCFGGLSFGEIGEQAALRVYAGAPEHVEPPALPEPHEPPNGGLHLVCYKPLFSGPAVERIEELQFQRPAAEVELAPADAKTRGIANGDTVTLSAGEVATTLRARVNKKLRPGIARVAVEHAGGLRGIVDATKAGDEVTA